MKNILQTATFYLESIGEVDTSENGTFHSSRSFPKIDINRQSGIMHFYEAQPGRNGQMRNCSK